MVLINMFHLIVIMLSIQVVQLLPRHFPSRERQNFFDTELLKALAKEDNRNFLISPASIKLLLGMLMESSDEQTSEEIRMALRLPKEREAIHKDFGTWLSKLKNSDYPNVVKVSSRIFLSDEYSINPTYQDTLKRHYDSDVSLVPFRDSKAAANEVNEWTATETNNLVPRLVADGQIQSDTKIMLASVVYFKGLWMHPFAKDRKTVKCFYPKEDKCLKAAMMAETAQYNFGYINSLDSHAVQIPYKGGKYSLLILLPTSVNGVDQLSRDLVHVSIESILSELKMQEVFLQIPEFEITYDTDLSRVFNKLQLSNLFTRKANFSNILSSSGADITLSHVFHSAKITVTEEGSEAGAVSGAGFVPLMGGTTTAFIANHPFLFFIMDSDVNSIVFAGKFAMPDRPRVSTSTEASAFSSATEPLALHPASTTLTSGDLDITSSAYVVKQSRPSRRGVPVGPKVRSLKENFAVPKIVFPMTPVSTSVPLSTSRMSLPSSEPVKKSSYDTEVMYQDSQPDTFQKRPRPKTQSQEPVWSSLNESSISEFLRHHILLFA